MLKRTYLRNDYFVEMNFGAAGYDFNGARYSRGKQKDKICFDLTPKKINRKSKMEQD